MSQSEISIHLILANISEKRELIRKIVQAILIIDFDRTLSAMAPPDV